MTQHNVYRNGFVHVCQQQGTGASVTTATNIFRPHPLRIQRSRKKGYRMPEGAIYVGRPSRWGNPFQAGCMYTSMNNKHLEYDFSAVTTPIPDRLGCESVFGMHTKELASEMAVLLFRHWIKCWSKRWPDAWADYIDPLRGRKLTCWCALSKPCHADILCELANAK